MNNSPCASLRYLVCLTPEIFKTIIYCHTLLISAQYFSLQFNGTKCIGLDLYHVSDTKDFSEIFANKDEGHMLFTNFWNMSKDGLRLRLIKNEKTFRTIGLQTGEKRLQSRREMAK